MTTSPDATRSIVIHVADAEQDVQRALDASVALREQFDGVRIRIIVNGPALSAVPDVDLSTVSGDVEVAVCRVGLQRRSIDETSLPPGVEVIATAPGAIVAEQFSGAAYLRL